MVYSQNLGIKQGTHETRGHFDDQQVGPKANSLVQMEWSFSIHHPTWGYPILTRRHTAVQSSTHALRDMVVS